MTTVHLAIKSPPASQGIMNSTPAILGAVIFVQGKQGAVTSTKVSQ